jgi:diadenosine tetraphosphate (Ap4A) HIT family hydrolase
MRKISRKLSLVRFNAERLPLAVRRKYPFRARRTYVFLGEMPNMPGHCVVIEHPSGKVFSGYHTENFVELPDTEV